MKSFWQCPRRDMCHKVGTHAQRLDQTQSSRAWQSLARQLEAMGELDIPKFKDLIIAIRVAHLNSKKRDTEKL